MDIVCIPVDYRDLHEMVEWALSLLRGGEKWLCHNTGVMHLSIVIYNGCLGNVDTNFKAKEPEIWSCWRQCIPQSMAAENGRNNVSEEESVVEWYF